MTMMHIDSHTAQSAVFHLSSMLDDLAAGCDPEFDAAYDDLEREFAELRCYLADE
jgi:hypothetical protein